MHHKPPRTRTEITQFRNYEVHTVGAPRLGFHDLYHLLLTAPWWASFAALVVGYLSLNALFALAFMATGGVCNVERGSFIDYFFFSIQTMGTIGYGTMAPVTRAANALVVVESVSGLVVTALATGLVFVRFSRVKTKVRFSKRAAIGPIEGVPTLMIRVGNERRAPIVDASFRLNMTHTLTTKEGVTMYRAEQLALVHERSPVLPTSLMMRHIIDEASPLFNETPESMAEHEVEIVASLTATDETSLQSVHVRQTWSAAEVVYGARLADTMTEPSPNRVILDLRRFDDLVPCEPTETFPYRADLEDLQALDESTLG